MEKEIEINCTNLEISEIIFKIVYVFQKHSDVILYFNLEDLKTPITNIFTLLRPVLYKILDEQINAGNKRKVIFKNIPKEIFYLSVLPAVSWWKFHDYIFCIHKALPKKYIDNFGLEEIEKYKLNIEKKETYFKYTKNFENSYLKEKYLLTLDHFLAEEAFKRCELVFAKSYPEDTLDSSSERFLYYVFNDIKNFQKDMVIFKNIFNKFFLDEMYPYLKLTNQYCFSIAKIKNNNVRKTFYINTSYFTKDLLNSFIKQFNLNIIEKDNLWGVGLDFILDEIVGYKIYYTKHNVVEEDFKNYVEEFEISQKVNYLFFIRHLKKPVNGVLFDKKFKKKEIISKRVDISLQFNPFLKDEIIKIPNFKKEMLEYVEPYTISFEISKNNKEKFNFYYTLK